MEQLQPIIAQRFWIAFGTALILSLVGWWVDTSESESLIEDREKKIKAAVQNASVGGGVPNTDWKAELDKINETQQDELDKAATVLWEKQQAAKVWPDEIASLMKDVPYRGTLANADGVGLYDLYKNAYQNQIRELWLSARPFDATTKEGSVILDRRMIPQVPEGTWVSTPPTWKEIWDAQEDIWLVRGILDSIRRLNESAEGGIREAPVRQISRLELRGGSRLQGAGGGDESGGDLGGGGDLDGGGDLGESDFGESEGFGGAGGSLLGGGGSTSGVDFNADEELGSASGSDAESGEEGDAGDLDEGDNGDGGRGLGGSSMLGMGGGLGSGSGSSGKRYVDDDPERPFKTRGFYLRVTVRHDMVPDLIAELTNSSFPVEILRVHQEDKHLDMIAGSNANNSFSGSGFGSSSAGSGRGGTGSGFGSSGSGFGSSGSGFGSGGSGFGSGGSGFGSGFGSSGRGAGAGFGAAGGGDDAGDFGGSGFGSESESMEGAEMAQQALEDRNLVEVVVVGLLTIYMPPAEDEQNNEFADAGNTNTNNPLTESDPQTDGSSASGSSAEAAGGVIDGEDGSTTPEADGAPAQGDQSGSEKDATDPATENNDPTAGSDSAAEGKDNTDSNGAATTEKPSGASP